MASNADKDEPGGTVVQVHDTPGEASAEKGVVLLDGPGNVAVAMTPLAAEATGKELQTAARDARRQSSSKASD